MGQRILLGAFDEAATARPPTRTPFGVLHASLRSPCSRRWSARQSHVCVNNTPGARGAPARLLQRLGGREREKAELTTMFGVFCTGAEIPNLEDHRQNSLAATGAAERRGRAPRRRLPTQVRSRGG